MFIIYSRFYRFKQKRPLGNLFTNDVTSGCEQDDSGIGNVTYVKDILAESVIIVGITKENGFATLLSCMFYL